MGENEYNPETFVGEDSNPRFPGCLVCCGMFLGLLGLLALPWWGGIILFLCASFPPLAWILQRGQCGRRTLQLANWMPIIVFGGFILVLSTIPEINPAGVRGRRISCSSRLRQIHLAFIQYEMDPPYQPPPFDGAAGLELLVESGILSYDILISPQRFYTSSPPREGAKLGEENTTYVFFGGIPVKDGEPPFPLAFNKPGRRPGFWQRLRWVDRRTTLPGIFKKPRGSIYVDYVNVLFSDGKVQGFHGEFPDCAAVMKRLDSEGLIPQSNRVDLMERAARYDRELLAGGR